MKKLTKGQAEAKIKEAIIKFEKEHLGRGPEEAQVYIIKDIVFIRLKGVLTIAEKQLAANKDDIYLIKETRMRLLESSRKILDDLILDIIGVKVKSMHTDISIKTGERIIVFTVEDDLDKNY